ncbi:unnamed protein product [Aureobasidium mustum]|uniref:Uncharacterized protein n=1 Tax=Aureobasidium mustum TaxID=2773714 RepID=A0A9N8KDE7_9PEZI|nr:unnamed protein product [Aureobasidium mustum]
MVCGSTTAAGVGLATIIIPALVVPFVLANLVGWTAFGIHKHRKHKRQRAQGGGYGSAAGPGNTFVSSTGPNGETVVTVVPAGGAGAGGYGGSAGGPGGAGSTGVSYTTGGVPVERREVVQTAGGPSGETVVVTQPH